jgi:hypothetical protein
MRIVEPTPDFLRLAKTDSPNKITARLPSKEGLKGIFMMLVGHPDSITKCFHRPMLIARADLDKLDEQICTKLGIHSIEATKTTINLTLSNNLILEFESWAGKHDINLAIPESVSSLMMKWDFLVVLPNYERPQRHTLTVRISTSPKPFHMMQALFSRDPSELDEFEMSAAPMICRVDFLSQILSQELINIVEAWHKGTREPKSLLPFNPNKPWIRRGLDIFLRYTLLISTTALSLAILSRHWAPTNSAATVTNSDLRFAILWLYLTFASIILAQFIGRRVAHFAISALAGFAPKTTFELTSGDLKVKDDNRRSHVVGIVQSGGAFVLTLIANLLAAYLFLKLSSKP